MNGPSLVFGSLFSGAGLLDAGLHQAGIGHAWFCESDEWRRSVLRDRWPGLPVREDVRKLGAGDVPPVDGIVGGFPCKGASSAGLQNGFDHPETVLWREMARIVGEFRPRYVVLENVANLLTIKKGLVWQEVLETLAALGFDVVWDCLPAASVGAPHLRDRIFAVAAHTGRARLEGHGRPSRVHAQVAADASHDPEAAPDTARDGEGGTASSARTDRERARTGSGVREAVTHARGGGWSGEGRRGAVEREQRSARADAQGQLEAVADADGRRGEERAEQDERAPVGQPASLWDNPERRGLRVEWGEYEPAIRRWETIHGPAPAPLTRVRGLDDGDRNLRRVRARVDRQRLSALGDGVQVQLGYIVGRYVLELEARRLGIYDEGERYGTHI